MNVIITILIFKIWDSRYHKALLRCKTLLRDVRFIANVGGTIIHLKRCARKNLTVTKQFANIASKHPEKICIIYGDERWTFKRLDEYSNRVANVFIETGFHPGDRVSLFMKNCPEYIGIWLGLVKAGLVTSLVNNNLRRVQLVHSILTIDSKAVVYGNELADSISDVLQELPRHVRVYRACKSFHDILMSGPTTCPEQRDVNNDDPLMYIFTSGTTGVSKGATVTHLKYITRCISAYNGLRMRSSDVIYNPLPLCHASGVVLGVGGMLLRGCTVVIRERFSATSYFPDCVKYQCTVGQYIGEMCRYVLATSPSVEDQLHKVRVMVGNGIRPYIWEKFQKRFNIPNICEFYGSSEGNANLLNNTNQIGSVGYLPRIFPKLWPIALIRLDPATGEPLRTKDGLCCLCEPGQAGEIVGRIVAGSPMREFHGYADKRANKSKIIENVWVKGDTAFRSGDVLIVDHLGFFYFMDRLGDTFRWKGENVSTTEVEAIISTICGLDNEVVVYGVEVPHCEGKAGMAAVIDSGNTLDMNKLSNGITDNLPVYARPLFVRLIKELHLTDTYKCQKNELLRQGFDPSKISDKMYFLQESEYVPLDRKLYQKIVDGEIRL